MACSGLCTCPGPAPAQPRVIGTFKGEAAGGTSRCVFVDRNVSVREVVCDQVTPDVQEASSSPPTPKAGSAIFRYKPRAGHVAHTWCAVTWRMRGAPSRGACVVHRHVVHAWCAVTAVQTLSCTSSAPGLHGADCVLGPVEGPLRPSERNFVMLTAA